MICIPKLWTEEFDNSRSKFFGLHNLGGGRGSSVNVITRLRDGQSRGLNPERSKSFFSLFSETSRLVLGPTQLHLRRVLVVLPAGVRVERPWREVDH